MRLVPWIIAITVVGLLLTAAVGGYVFDANWTGVNEISQPKKSTPDIRREKTLWDWLQLLVVPAAVAGVGLWFTWAQSNREQRLENERQQREQAVEDQRTQDDALQAYLEYMGELVVDKNLRSASSDASAAVIARARTLTVLNRLHNSHTSVERGHNKDRRKRSVLQFLYESQLINKGLPVIDLSHANLSNADLSLTVGVGVGGDISLARFNLSYADLTESLLRDADLSDANLEGTDLSGANLFNANLRNANMRGALLHQTFLARTDLDQADLTGADLSQAKGLSNNQLELLRSFPQITMPDGSTS